MKYQTRIQKELCNASICTEKKIQAIRKRIEKADQLNQTTLFAKVVGDRTRGRIVYLLYKQKALCVCDIANILDISIASASQHLRKMKDLKLVVTHKDGTTIFYALSDDRFTAFLKRIYG